MEESAINSTDITSSEPLNVTEYSKRNLKEISRWTMFFSILGFVFIGLMVLAGFFMGSLIPKLSGQEESLPFPGFLFGIIYAFMGIIYFPPVLFLFKFTRGIRNALNNNNSGEMDQAFQNLKSHYRYIGILVAIILTIYILAGLILAILSVFMHSGGGKFV